MTTQKVDEQFEERMKQKREEEAKQAENAAERDRQAYLRRTGRTELKP